LKSRYTPWKSGGGCSGTLIEEADRDELGRVALTKQQAAVLNYIRSHIAKHGWPPSLREMEAHWGWASPNAAACHVAVLERKGWIVRGHGLARAIRIVGD
jgi:repressor LexA